MSPISQHTATVILAAIVLLPSVSPDVVLPATGHRPPTEPDVYSPSKPSRSTSQSPAQSRDNSANISLSHILDTCYLLREHNGDGDPRQSSA